MYLSAKYLKCNRDANVCICPLGFFNNVIMLWGASCIKTTSRATIQCLLKTHATPLHSYNNPLHIKKRTKHDAGANKVVGVEYASPKTENRHKYERAKKRKGQLGKIGDLSKLPFTTHGSSINFCNWVGLGQMDHALTHGGFGPSFNIGCH